MVMKTPHSRLIYNGQGFWLSMMGVLPESLQVVMEWQVLLLVPRLKWSHVGLIEETLVVKANRFPLLSNLGLIDFGSRSLRIVLQDGSLLEISGSDSKDPSSKELVIRVGASKPSKVLKLS